MSDNSFFARLRLASEANRSLLCVGLDPDQNRMPISDVFEFNRAIVDATRDLVCCYKPNLAFYEAFGPSGLETLRRTLEYIDGDVPVIGDAKRGDIGNTARAYASALFEYYGLDAVTANPYMGGDTLAPFLDYANRGVFVVCRTSNPGSGDFQSLPVTRPDGEQWPLYMEVAKRCSEWNTSGGVGLVVGATYPEELQKVRALCPDMPILIPGIGAQGGDLRASVVNGLDARGGGILISASRQVIYASKGIDFAERARESALDLRDRINQCRSEAVRLQA